MRAVTIRTILVLSVGSLLAVLTAACDSISEPVATTTPATMTETPTVTATPSPTFEPTSTPTTTPTPTPVAESSWQCDPSGGLACSVDFHTVVMWDEQTGWIFGDEGIALRYEIGPGEDTSAWHPDDNLSSPYRIVKFSPINASEGWGVSGYIARYQNEQWENIQEIEGVEFRDVIMLSASEGWSVGRDISKTTIPWDGLIFHYTNDEWSKVFTLPFAPLLAIDMLNSEEGWAVGGSDGVVVRYHDQLWEQVKPTFRGKHTFLDVDVVGEEEVWIVGQRIILHYDNGNWEEVASDLTEGLLFDPVIDMISANEGWIVGRNGYILHYQDGQWQEVDSPTDNDLLSISMVSAEEGWAVGRNGTILHYQNGVWKLVNEAQ